VVGLVGFWFWGVGVFVFICVGLGGWVCSVLSC